jgi:hypothetical protein
MTLGWHELEIKSRALEGNPLSENSPARPLFVWTPPAYRRAPAPLVDLPAAGSDGRGAGVVQHVAPFVKSKPAMVEEPASRRSIVFVDASRRSRLACLDSPAIGALWHLPD